VYGVVPCIALVASLKTILRKTSRKLACGKKSATDIFMILFNRWDYKT
jgi:hypothetical protein